MAKRAAKLAEDAADIDAIEAVAGAPSHEHLGPFQYAGAWLAAVAAVIVLAVALQLVCRQGAPDFSPPGPLSRGDSAGGQADTGAFYHEGGGQRGRSPFPKPATVDPTIIEVVCPAGTVHISTGPNAADSLCVKGALAALPASPTPPTPPTPTPTVPTAAASPVPQPSYSLPDTGSR